MPNSLDKEPLSSQEELEQPLIQRKFGSYILGRTLGTGASSKVKLGVHEHTGERVAIKIMRKSDDNVPNIQTEVEVMKTLDHERIVRLYDSDWDAVYVKKNGKQYSAVILVLELVAGGEMFDFLSETGKFDEIVARTHFRQLMSGLQAIHEQGVAHRDLKPQNLLLDQRYGLKIADFGAANYMYEDNTMYTDIGTASYQAPEISRNQGYDGCAADVWSSAVVLFACLAGFPPYKSPSSRDRWFTRLCNDMPAFWSEHLKYASFSAEAMDLLSQMLLLDPDERITVQEIHEHPWFNGEVLSESQLYETLSSKKRKVLSPEARRAAHQEHSNSSVGSVASLDSLDDSPREIFRSVSDDSRNPIGSPWQFVGRERRARDQQSVSTLDDEFNGEEIKLLSEPREVDPSVWVHTSFKSDHKAIEVWKGLNKVFTKLDRNCVVKHDSSGKFKIKAHLLNRDGSAYVDVSAELFSSCNSSSSSGQTQQSLSRYEVQVKKVRGQPFDFLEMYKLIWGQLSYLISNDTDSIPQ